MGADLLVFEKRKSLFLPINIGIMDINIKMDRSQVPIDSSLLASHKARSTISSDLLQVIGNGCQPAFTNGLRTPKKSFIACRMSSFRGICSSLEIRARSACWSAVRYRVTSFLVVPAGNFGRAISLTSLQGKGMQIS